MKSLRAIACLVLFAGAVLLAHSLITGADLPPPEVTIKVSGDYRYIRGNGIPNHKTGMFPNRGNPNSIRPQRYDFRVAAQPVAANRTTPFELGKFGIAVNGIPFDPGAAEWWNRDPRSGWQYEALSPRVQLGMDASNAHVQPDGAYHYHGVPVGLIDVLKGNGSAQQMFLLGYAADGFPIYGPYGHTKAKDKDSPLAKLKPSYQLKKGQRPGGPRGNYDGTFVQDYEFVPGAGDLDECNGRFGVTPEYPAGIYHYYLTETFPFIPRAFRGVPDRKFLQPPGPPPFGKGPPFFKKK